MNLRFLTASLLGVLLLVGPGFAMPDMPPSPVPADTVLKVATAFAIDIDRAEQMERHLKIPYFQRTPHQRLPETLIPPELLPGGYKPADRAKLDFTYQIRHNVERHQYASEVQRTGPDFVKVSCDGEFPTLQSASDLVEGVSVLVLPNDGKEAHQLHVISLLPDGRVGVGTAAHGSGRVHFTDGKQYFDVAIPFDGSQIQILAVIPKDTSF